MTHYTASIDAGNGHVNAYVDRGKGRPKNLSFASVRARASGKSMGLNGMELKYQTVGWAGRTYIVGDDATAISRTGIERHTGTSNRYGNELHRHLIATAIARLGVKSGEISLVTYLPPGMYQDIREDVRERFLQEPDVIIKLDDKKHSFTYTDVTLFPEGMAAIGCFTVDVKYQPQNADEVLSGDVLILDCGAYTLDAILLSNGKLNPEMPGRHTYEDGGIDELVRQPLLNWLHDQHEDFTRLSVEDVDRVITQGSDIGDYVMRAGAAKLDLGRTIDELRRDYADWISNVVIDSVFRDLRGIRQVLLVGGGATLAGSRLRELYGDKVLDTSKHPATKKISPSDMNAIGGLRLARMRQMAGT